MYYYYYSLHTACCECVCLSFVYVLSMLSMHFTLSLSVFSVPTLSPEILSVAHFIRKSILFHLLRSVHAYYFSDYIKINGCSREREAEKKEFATCRVCLNRDDRVWNVNAFSQIQKHTQNWIKRIGTASSDENGDYALFGGYFRPGCGPWGTRLSLMAMTSLLGVHLNPDLSFKPKQRLQLQLP